MNISFNNICNLLYLDFNQNIVYIKCYNNEFIKYNVNKDIFIYNN